MEAETGPRVTWSRDFPSERCRWRDMGLVLAACIPMLLNLWELPLWGSEGRWLLIAEDMRYTGRWLEPSLEGEFYGDKPLLSYWAIVLASFATGKVDEGTSRLPSALAGVASALLTAWMAARLLGRRHSVLAGSILATAFSFFFWSRSASADLLTVAFATGAVAVYLEAAIGFKRWHPFAFFVLLGLGGQTKGMPGVIVPLGAAGLDILLSQRWHILRRVGPMALGFISGCVVYALPLVLSRLAHGDWRLVELMWRENFVRAFAAFDHKADPFYYVYTLPAMFLPWTLWLLGGLGWACKRSLAHAGFRFALAAFAFVFIAFTASESRRSYYILPIFPFAALLSAGFCGELAQAWSGKSPVHRRLWGVFAVSPVYILATLLLLCCVFVLVGPVLPGAAVDLWQALPYRPLLGALAGAGAMAIFIAHRLWGLWASFHASVFAVTLCCAYIATGVDAIRSARLVERPFAQEVKSALPGKTVLCFGPGNSRLRHYLGVAEDLKTVEELEAAMQSRGTAIEVVCTPKGIALLEESPRVSFSELRRATAPGFGPFSAPRTTYFLLRCEKKA